MGKIYLISALHMPDKLYLIIEYLIGSVQLFMIMTWRGRVYSWRTPHASMCARSSSLALEQLHRKKIICGSADESLVTSDQVNNRPSPEMRLQSINALRLTSHKK